MRKMLAFEFKKMIYNKKNICLMIILMIYLFVLFYMSVNLTKNFSTDAINHNKEQIVTLSEQVKIAENDLNNKDLDKATVEFIEKYISDTKDTISILELQNDTININPKEYWLLQSKLYSKMVEAPEGNLQPDEMTNIKIVQNKIAILDKENIEFEENIHDPIRAFPYFEKNVVFISSLIVLLIISLLIGDIMSKDYVDKSLYIYRNIVNKEKKILFSKLVVATIVPYVSFLICISIFFIVNGLVTGFGSFKYPVFYSGQGDHLIYDNMAVFGVKFIFVFLVILYMYSSLSILLGILTKNVMLSTGLLSILIITMDYLSNVPSVKEVLKYLPINYFGVYKILSYDSIIGDRIIIVIGYLLIFCLFLNICNYYLLKNKKAWCF